MIEVFFHHHHHHHHHHHFRVHAASVKKLPDSKSLGKRYIVDGRLDFTGIALEPSLELPKHLEHLDERLD